MSHKKLRGTKEKNAAYIYVHHIDIDKAVSGIVFLTPYGSIKKLQCFDGPGIQKFVAFVERTYKDISIKDISIFYDTEGTDIEFHLYSSILSIRRNHAKNPHMDLAKEIAYSTPYLKKVIE